MNLNSITGLAGVTVFAGVTPFAAGGAANDGTVVTGTLTSNNMRMGSIDGPAFDVFASISGLSAGSENTRQVSGLVLNFGQVIQNTGTTPSVGRLNSVGIHQQFNNRGYVVNNPIDTIITQDGRLFLTTLQQYYEVGANTLSPTNVIVGSGDPNTNKEYYQFGGIRPTGSST